MSDRAWWYDEGECGPPTLEDDLWFTSHMDDPVKRDPKPMEGQEVLPGIYQVGGTIHWADGRKTELPTEMVEYDPRDDNSPDVW